MYQKEKPLLFLLPSLTVLVLVVIFPTVFLYYSSFFRWGLGAWHDRAFVGLYNYYFVLTDRFFYNSLIITLAYMFMCVTLEFLFGLVIAMTIAKIRVRAVVISLLLIPMIIAPAAAGLIWSLMLNYTYGVIPYILKKLIGFSPAFLGPDYAFLSTVLVDVWMWTPFVALVILAGMEALPREPFEAAQLDGASSWQIFQHITIPLLKPLLIFIILLRSIDALKTFDTIYVLTGGGPGQATEVLSLRIFKTGFFWGGYEMGKASVIAIFLILLSTLLVSTFINIFRRLIRV